MADQIRIERPVFSMFAETPVYHGIEATIDGERQESLVFGLMRSPVVPSADDEIFTVPPGGRYRLDLISQSFYGVPDLWWVIARVNNLIDPLPAPEAGTKLRIPTRSRLATLGILNV